MRGLITSILATAAFAGCIATPAWATDAPSCTSTVSPTWVFDDDLVGWMVGTTTTTATCTADWRVALSPQYQTSDGAWHGGTTVFNHIYYPAFNAFYNGGTTHTQDPACCILYWDDGDGTENFVPLCRYPWRIHAGYWTPTDIGRAKVADAYSEPTVPTCSPPLAPVR